MTLESRSAHLHLWRLSLPLMLASISTPIINLVDTAVVRDLPEAYHLAAVTLGAMVFNYGYWAFAFLRLATTGLTAQAMGAQQGAEVRATLLRAVALAVGLGVLFVPLIGPLSSFALAHLEASDQVREHAHLYITTRVFSFPTSLANYALTGWLVGLQRNRLALGLEAIRVVAYAGFDVLMVHGLGLGVRGLGIAAGLAELVMTIACGLVAYRVYREHSDSGSVGRLFEPRALRGLFTMNVDLFIRIQCVIVAWAGFTAQGAMLGDATLAANAVLINLYLFITYAVSTFGQVGTTLVGVAVGKRDSGELARAIDVTNKWAVGSTLVCSLVFALVGPNLVGLLTEVEEVSRLARAHLLFAAVMPVVSVLGFQLDGIAVGAGKTGPLRNVLLIALGVYALAAWTLPARYGNTGLWLSLGAFMGARSLAYVVLLPSLRRAV